MAVTLRELNGGRNLEVTVQGKLQRDDYETLVPHFERLVKEHGKVGILFLMEDFHGWTAGALWEDIKLDVKHFRDIQRIAMVGETKWQEWMSKFCRPFTTAEIRYFDHDHLEDARAWVLEGVESPAARSEG